MFINKKKLQNIVNAQILTVLILLLNAALPIEHAWGQALSLVNSVGDTLMHVQEGSNVGIGTTNPKAKLSVSFSNSDMLNFYSPADNTLAIQTTIDDRDLSNPGDQQIQNRLVLQPLVGNVGIGTTTPSDKLHVVDGTIFIDAETTGTDGLALQNGVGNVFWINSPASNRMDIGGRGNLDSPPTSGAISILDNDNVGIGTTGPAEKLDVNGDMILDDGDPQLTLFRNDPEFYHLKRTGTNVQLSSGGTLTLQSNVGFLNFRSGTMVLGRWANNGNLGIGEGNPDAKLEVVGDLMVSSIASGNGDRFIVGTDGKVGIGTATPSAFLHVHNSDNSSDNPGEIFVIDFRKHLSPTYQLITDRCT